MTISSNNTDVFAVTVSGGGGGTPATTVVTETAFGQASAVGTSTDYARADHTHGTPATPAVFDSLKRSGWIQSALSGVGPQWAGSGQLQSVSSVSGTPDTYVSGKLFNYYNYIGATFWCQIESLPVLSAVIHTDATAALAGTYFGFSSAFPPHAIAGSQYTFLMFDRSVYPGQTNWYLVTDNGGTVFVDTGIAYANNTVYTMEVSFPTLTSVQAKINGTVVATSPSATGTGWYVGYGISDTNSVGLNRMWIQEGV